MENSFGSAQEISSVERLCDQFLEDYWIFFDGGTGSPTSSVKSIKSQVESCEGILRALQRQQHVKWNEAHLDSLRKTLEQCVEVFEGSRSGGSGYGSKDPLMPKQVYGMFRHIRNESKWRKLSKTLKDNTDYLSSLQCLPRFVLVSYSGSLSLIIYQKKRPTQTSQKV